MIMTKRHDLAPSADRGKPWGMRCLALSPLVLGLLSAREAEGEVIIDSDTTIDYVIPDMVSIVEGPDPPTVVQIVSPARIGDVRVYDSSVLTLSDGSIADFQDFSGALRAHDSSTVNIEGGSVEILQAWDFSTVNFSDGHLDGKFEAYDFSTLNVSGGENDWHLVAYDSSVVHLSGGDIDNDLYAYDSSTIHIYGYDLDITDERLTGILADRLYDLDKGAYSRGDPGGRFVLHNIPEPSTLVGLLSIGAVALLAFARRRREKRIGV